MFARLMTKIRIKIESTRDSIEVELKKNKNKELSCTFLRKNTNNS